jgi:hypothetical protein
MNPSVQVVLNFVAGLFSDLLGPGEHHRDEHPSRLGSPPRAHLLRDTSPIQMQRSAFPTCVAITATQTDHPFRGREPTLLLIVAKFISGADAPRGPPCSVDYVCFTMSSPWD